ncbi:MAG: 23S rRNA (adenine(2503)-C2)-methyltransferase, partial [Anaerolineae bacterium]|nr:23S rRNA (adenine(2503)-C2)-methyltransferase [Anaerolineae bacterium]
TTKTLFRLHDGQLIETVLMRYHRRNTVCISSQAGCAMGCTFCATALMGLQRNLTPGEIVAQVLHFQRWLDE